MDLIYTLTMLIPVILVAAFIIYIVKGYFLDGKDLKSLNVAAIVPAVVILMVAILVIAPMAQMNAPFRYDADDGELTITKNIDQDSTYPWNSYAQDVTSLNIRNGVTSVAPNAFSSLTNLRYLSIPDSMSGANTAAFGVTLSNPFDEPLSTVQSGDYAGTGDGTLYLCDPSLYTYDASGMAITGLTISGQTAAVLVIPDSYEGKAVTSIASGTTSAPTMAGGFQTVLFTKDSALATIGTSAFQNASSMTSITLPSTVSSIGFSAFAGSGLTSVSLPDGITTISRSTFNGCTSLASVSLPDSLTTIGNRGFELCSSLTEINVPSSIETIDELAFYGCTSLASFSFPSTLNNIGSKAFGNCTAITSVTFARGFAPELASDWADGWTFYDTNGTTQLDASDATVLAGSTFSGTAAALVKVQPGRSTLTEEQALKVQELTDLAKSMGPSIIDEREFSSAFVGPVAA